MTTHDRLDPASRDDERDQSAPKLTRRHSLAGAAICLGAGAAIALITILDRAG